MSSADIKKTIHEVVENDPKLKEEIERISLFGSQARGDATETSDVDLLVEFHPEAHVGLFRLCHIENLFADALRRPVDMATPRALSKYIRDDIYKQLVPLYER